MFKRNKIKLSVLIIAIVVFGVIFSTLASTLFFGIFYKNSMFDSAYVSSRQAVSQANETVSNYVSSIKNKLDNLCDEMNNCTDTSSLQNAISTASRLEEDIYCVMLYDMQGKMDELNMKYFGEMYTDLEKTFAGINETLAANREEMKNLAYKTQNEVESGTFAPGEEEE